MAIAEQGELKGRFFKRRDETGCEYMGQILEVTSDGRLIAQLYDINEKPIQIATFLAEDVKREHWALYDKYETFSKALKDIRTILVRRWAADNQRD